MEPHRLRRWKIKPSPDNEVGFYTCARPGRSKGPTEPVPDAVVSNWVRGLRGEGVGTIISLLGRKTGPMGMSEFSFYSFCGGFDTPAERKRRPTFQEWLGQKHGDLTISVIEHPTYDFKRMSSGILDTIRTDIYTLAQEGKIFIIVDSGGQTRTRAVCKHMDAVEDTTWRRA